MAFIDWFILTYVPLPTPLFGAEFYAGAGLIAAVGLFSFWFINGPLRPLGGHRPGDYNDWNIERSAGRGRVAPQNKKLSLLERYNNAHSQPAVTRYFESRRLDALTTYVPPTPRNVEKLLTELRNPPLTQQAVRWAVKQVQSLFAWLRDTITRWEVTARQAPSALSELWVDLLNSPTLTSFLISSSVVTVLAASATALWYCCVFYIWESVSGRTAAAVVAAAAVIKSVFGVGSLNTPNPGKYIPSRGSPRWGIPRGGVPSMSTPPKAVPGSGLPISCVTGHGIPLGDAPASSTPQSTPQSTVGGGIAGAGIYAGDISRNVFDWGVLHNGSGTWHI